MARRPWINSLYKLSRGINLILHEIMRISVDPCTNILSMLVGMNVPITDASVTLSIGRGSMHSPTDRAYALQVGGANCAGVLAKNAKHKRWLRLFSIDRSKWLVVVARLLPFGGGSRQPAWR